MPAVRNYIQFTLRAELERRKQTILHPFTKQPVDNITTEMAMAWFSGVVAVKAALGDEPLRRQPFKLRPPALKILDLLGLTVADFARPPPLR